MKNVKKSATTLVEEKTAQTLLTPEEITDRMSNVFQSDLATHLSEVEMEACKAVSTKLFPHQVLVRGHPSVISLKPRFHNKLLMIQNKTKTKEPNINWARKLIFKHICN